MSKAKTKERVERMLIEADRINARNKRVLELFLYGNDKRTRIIAEIVYNFKNRERQTII